jgi:hypothetical protein
MKIQTQTKKKGLQVDRILMPEVVKVTFEPPDATPEDVLLHWKHKYWKEPIVQRLPAKLEGNSAFARVIAIIRGKSLTPEELEQGYDPVELIGRKSPVFVTTKPGAGGKPVPAIGPVFDLKTLKADVAALEVQPAIEPRQGSSEADNSE